MEQIKNHPLYRAHTIDSAMNSLWEFYTKRFLVLFTISFAMGLVLQYLSSRIFIDLGDYQSFNPEEVLAKLREYVWPMLGISLANILFTLILHCYVIFSPLDADLNILSCILKAFRYLIPYILTLILLVFAGSIALFLGLLLLVIGVFFAALYIMMLYLFILPVMLVEGPLIANVISRTVTLSHRRFWSNIGWTAVFVILLLVISMIISGVILIPFTGSFLSAIRNPENAADMMEITTRPLYIILSAVVNGLTLSLMPIFACILYFNGRAREDVPADSGPGLYEPENRLKVDDLYARPSTDEEKDTN